MRKVKAAGPVTGAELNAWIREVSGHGPPAAEPAAQPEGDQVTAPPVHIPSANAGNGAKAAGIAPPRLDMNALIRSGRGRSWTVNG